MSVEKARSPEAIAICITGACRCDGAWTSRNRHTPNCGFNNYYEAIVEALSAQAADHLKALAAAKAKMREVEADNAALLKAYTNLTAESRGVIGLHLNGDVATWEWLENNQWLEAFTKDHPGATLTAQMAGLREACAFFMSAVKSGETWTERCDEERSKVFSSAAQEEWP